MAVVDCGQGHLYDNSLYPSCPYCKGNSKVVVYTSDTSGRSGGGTVAPQGLGFASSRSSGATVAPGGFGGGEGHANEGTVAPGWVQQSNSEKNQTGTVAPGWAQKPKSGSYKTVGRLERKHGIDPVVGWLVCIEGKNRGSDFRLRGKINTIGRELSNDVCIQGDESVSRENHASVAYDTKHNHFYVFRGTGSSSEIYLNDEPVYTQTQLKAHDVIECGDCKLLFIPLCDEHFHWE